MITFKEYIVEVLNTKVPYEIEHAGAEQFSTSATIGGRLITFYASTGDGEPGVWEIEFDERVENATGSMTSRKTTYKQTGSGSELQVFSMIKDSIIELVKRYEPEVIMFTADKEGDNDTRAELYARLLKRFTLPEYKTDVSQSSRKTEFTLTKREEYA